MPDAGDFNYHLRSFRSSDLAVCRDLYRHGIVRGQLAANDSGLDIDDIVNAYMKPNGNHFWVAETPEKVVGMIGVMLSDGTGEIRRLRVADGFRGHGVGSSLLEQAVKFCRDNNYLKLAIDTYVDRDYAINLLQKLHYKLGNTRTYNGKDLMVFYLDLYSSDDKGGGS